MESDDTGSYFLVTRKVLDELDDVNAPLPVIYDILRYNGTEWICVPDISILNNIILGAGLAWNYLTKTLSLTNPLPATTIPSSALTSTSLGAPQWTVFSVGSASKPSFLSYNGTTFSGI